MDMLLLLLFRQTKISKEKKIFSPFFHSKKNKQKPIYLCIDHLFMKFIILIRKKSGKKLDNKKKKKMDKFIIRIRIRIKKHELIDVSTNTHRHTDTHKNLFTIKIKIIIWFWKLARYFFFVVVILKCKENFFKWKKNQNQPNIISPQ